MCLFLYVCACKYDVELIWFFYSFIFLNVAFFPLLFHFLIKIFDLVPSNWIYNNTAQCRTSSKADRRNLSMASVGYNSEQSSIRCSWWYFRYHRFGSIEKFGPRQSKYISYLLSSVASISIHFELFLFIHICIMSHMGMKKNILAKFIFVNTHESWKINLDFSDWIRIHFCEWVPFFIKLIFII